MSTLAHPAREDIATSQRQNRSRTASTKVSEACRGDRRQSTRGTFPGARNSCRKLAQRRSEGGLAPALKARRTWLRIESVASVKARKPTATHHRSEQSLRCYPVRRGALVGFFASRNPAVETVTRSAVPLACRLWWEALSFSTINRMRREKEFEIPTYNALHLQSSTVVVRKR